MISSLHQIIKRDITLRYNNAKNALMYNLLILILISLLSILMDEGNDLLVILLTKVFGGFSYSSLDDFLSKSGLSLPYYWLLFQTLFILSLGTYFNDDLIQTSEFVIIRTGKERFINSKILSLLIYCFIYIISLLALIVIIALLFYLIGFSDIFTSFYRNIIEVNSKSIFFIYFFYLGLTLFIEAMFFEFLSLKFNQIVGFISIIFLLFVSMFNRNILLIGSYSMLYRWTESDILINNQVTILIWIFFLIVLLYIVIRTVAYSIDLVSRKGVEK